MEERVPYGNDGKVRSAPVVCEALFQQVVRILAGCQGKANAMTLQDIGNEAARWMDMPESREARRRMVERAIEENLNRIPWPIVSGDDGLWIPDDPADLNRYLTSLKTRCVKMFMRRKIVRKKALLAGFRLTPAGFGQPVARSGELF